MLLPKFDNILRFLRDAKSNGAGFVAHCPVCGDNEWSLSVDRAGNGDALLFCLTGCRNAAIADWFLAQEKSAANHTSESYVNKPLIGCVTANIDDERGPAALSKDRPLSRKPARNSLPDPIRGKSNTEGALAVYDNPVPAYPISEACRGIIVDFADHVQHAHTAGQLITGIAPSTEAEESARVLIAGVLKSDVDSIAAALTVPLEAFDLDSHRQVMHALRVLRERGIVTPEVADFLPEIDPEICGPLELSVLTEPRPSTSPMLRAHTLREDFVRRQWQDKATKFASLLPTLTAVAARAEFDAMFSSFEVTPDGWPTPCQLPETLIKVEPFLPELLPDAFRAFVMDVAERLQSPPDFIAVAIMVALGSLVGRQMGIRPKQKDNLLVVPNLWGAGTGVPSVKKTPAMQAAMNLLARLDAKARDNFNAAFDEFSRTMEVHEHRVKAAKKAASRVAEKSSDESAIREALDAVGYAPPQPLRRRYWTNDPTVEKLGELLRDNPNGLLVFRDELTGWLRTLDRDGREADKAFYLEAWNGTGRFTSDRIGRGTVEIDAACVSILGGIQPGPLTEYFRSALQNGAGADGLIQRFQLLVWPDIAREWRNVDRWPDTDALDAACAVFERLNNIDPAGIGAEIDKHGAIHFLRFADNAQQEFYHWQDEFNNRLRAMNADDALKAHLAKYESMVAALALLIHLADSPNGGAVSLVALERALGWVEYLESHARRVYGSCVRGDVDAARTLLHRIESGDLPRPFTAKDVYKNHWAGLSRREDVEAALVVLEDFGWVRGHKVETGGRPTVHYVAHPSLRKAG